MRIFDSDFVVTEGLSCPSARAPRAHLDQAPTVHIYRLTKKFSDAEVFKSLENKGTGKDKCFFTLEEFNRLLSEEIDLFNKKEDGKIKLYSNSATFPFFNFYVRDEGAEYVVELSLLFRDNCPDWMLYYNLVHESSWAEGTYVVVKK